MSLYDFVMTAFVVLVVSALVILWPYGSTGKDS